jgi:hypothetical protein
MRSIQDNFDKHLLITLIVLIVLPICLAMSSFAIDIPFFSNPIVDFYIDNFSDYDNSLSTQLFESLKILQYAIFVVMLVIYPCYPYLLSLRKYYGKRNPRSVIIEHEVLMKITIVLFPFFIFGLGLIIASRLAEENPLNNVLDSLGNIGDSIIIISGVIIFVVGSALLRIILLTISKDFRFYLAKIFFRAILNVEDEVEKMKYLINGLSSYNKYIRRALGLQINNLKEIYSKIVSDPAIDISMVIRELSSSFEEKDKLESIRCITELMKVTDLEHFLVKESLGKKLGDLAGIIGTLASTVAAVLGAMITLLPKPQ